MSALSSTTRLALITEIKLCMSNWGVNLSMSQMSSLLSHIESVINANSGTALADITSDLANFPESTHGRHS